jgi:hypothetical protein
MSDPTTASQIPLSNALEEASPDSLAELLNRDPEGYSRQDRARIVLAYREMRERMALAAAKSASAPDGSKRAGGEGRKRVAGVVASPVSAEELDL